MTIKTSLLAGAIAAGGAFTSASGEAAVYYRLDEGENFIEFESDSFGMEQNVGSFTKTSGFYFSAQFNADCSNSSLSPPTCDALTVSRTNGSFERLFFDDGALSTPGIYDARRSSGRLTVSLTPIVAAAVPEPVTWATMMLGFGLVGMAARRRRIAAGPRKHGM